MPNIPLRRRVRRTITGGAPSGVTITAGPIVTVTATSAAITATTSVASQRRLRYRTGTGAWVTNDRTAAPGTDHTINLVGLAPSTTYTAELYFAPAGAAYPSTPTRTLTITTAAATVTPPLEQPVGQPGNPNPTALPGQITGLTIGAVTSTQIRLAWDSDAQATTYLLEYRRKDGSYWAARAAQPTTNAWVMTSLSTSMTYGFRVSGVNRFGTGVASVEVLGTTSIATGNEDPRGEGLNDEPRPVVAPTTGGPKAGDFDILAYDWNGVGRTSTAPLVPPNGDVDIVVPTGATVSDRVSGWRGEFALAHGSHLTQSHIVSQAGPAYAGDTSTFTINPATQARISYCSSEPGPVTAKVGGGMHIDHSYITTADDGQRNINNGRRHMRGTMQYCWVHRPYGRSLNPDGTKSEAHHDGVQAFGLLNGADYYRCMMEGFSVGILNTTAETAPVVGLRVEQCWLENDRGAAVIHYGTKAANGPAPSQKTGMKDLAPGDPTWVTYKDCLVGPIAANAKIIGQTYVMRSEAERYAMHAAGASAILFYRVTDPKTGASIKNAQGKYIEAPGRIVSAPAIVVFENTRWGGREFVTGAPDPDPTHTPGAPVDWKGQQVTWPPKPLPDGTVWWTYDKPKHLHGTARGKAATFTAAGFQDLVIPWTYPAQSNDYEVFALKMSAWSSGIVYPEVIAHSRTSVTVRVTATGPTSALSAAQHTIYVGYREYRPGDIPEEPAPGITKMAS